MTDLDTEALEVCPQSLKCYEIHHFNQNDNTSCHFDPFDFAQGRLEKSLESY
jgi:hypothetical protein